METTQQFTVEAFTTGERRTATAPHWWDALADQPDACFTVLRNQNGHYVAVSLKNDVFPIPGEKVAASPEAAAAAIRQHYETIKAARS